MIAAAVVDQGGVQRIGEGEAAQRALVEVVHGGGAASDVAAGDQQHQHVVDAVAVQALGRGLAVLAGLRFDAELMDLGVPALGIGGELAEEGAAVFEDGAQRGALADLVGDRLEPALDAAVQRVVIEPLVMRLVRPAHDRALAFRGIDGEAAAAVAPAVAHVGVDVEVVPALGEGGPVAERAEAGEGGAHVRGFDEGISRARDGAADARGVLQAGSDLAHDNERIIAAPVRHMS